MGDRKLAADIDQLAGMGFSKEDARAALEEKKTVQEALEWLLSKGDSAPPVAALAKPAPKASYAQMAGGSSPSPAAAPLPSAAIPVPRTYGSSEANVPVARPGHTTLPSPRFQSKVANSFSKILNSVQEEEDYEKAIKQSLAETGNRDASGEPLDPNERKRQPGIPAGLKNIGNTCYFNSLVHIYNSLPLFRNLILRLPWREPSIVDPPEVTMLLELQRLFGFLSVTPRKYLDPTALVKILIEARGPGAKLGTQEDPTEFNLHFLKQVRSGCKRLDADTRAKLSELFKGSQIQRVKSTEKDGSPTEAITKERSGQIILDLRDNRPQSVYTCMDDFTQPTIIEDYVTPKKHVAMATRYVTWESFPPVLFFQLQRALYDREQKQLVKLSTPYTIETTIYLDRYLESNFVDVLRRRQRGLEIAEEIRKAENSIEAMQNFHGMKLSLAQVLQLSHDYFSEETRKMSDGPGLGAVKRRQQISTALEALNAETASVNERLNTLQKSVESLKQQRDGLFSDMKRVPYRLHAVLVHDGRSVGSGHYWAYLYERDTERWILYNDQHVSVVTEEEVLTMKPPRNRQDCQPTVYCLVYLSDKLAQSSVGMKMEPLPNSLSLNAERDANAFNDELTRWNDAKAAGRNPDPMGQKVDAFKQRFFARLESCIADVTGKNALPDGRLRSFAHYLLSIDSQDLLQYELAAEVWRELYPESSFTHRHGDFPRRLEESLDQVPWRLALHQESQLRELRAEFRTVLQLADWIQQGLNLLIQERWFDAVVYLLHAFKRERAAPRKRFPELADYTRLCLLGVARTLWTQIEGGDYASALDQGWKLAVLVIDDFPRSDPLCVVLRSEWNRHLDFLESKSRVSPAIPMDLVRRIRDMYALHTTRHAQSIRLTEPDRSSNIDSNVASVYERYAAAVLTANNNRVLVPLRKLLAGQP